MIALKRYFSYIRVSTLRQGQHGTSLTEQREAIKRYAQRWNLTIIEEFEEKETAAKFGRPIFNRMLKALKRGQADGVLIHKIDRSARNLRDWADLGELIDQGIEVHFANESLDLHSRGGRLSADIQAVVAADYIRNLREETRKGFYGRIKQGLYPCPAPTGYLDCGKGQPKQVDPVQGPLVKQAFELYASGSYSLIALVEEMHALGLRNKKGGKVTLNGMSNILHNPFYLGLVKIKTQDEVYTGCHSPIITRQLFNQVQDVLQGKHIKVKQRHDMLFRRMLICVGCGKKLRGELHKGYNYYRCHTKGCAQKSIREDKAEAILLPVLKSLSFSNGETARIRQHLKEEYRDIEKFKEAQASSLQLQLEQIRGRLSKVVDAYIDGMLDEEIYLAKKNMLVLEENAAKRLLENLDAGAEAVLRKVEEMVELVNSAYLSYKIASSDERREIVEIVTSNLVVEDKKLIVKLDKPFEMISEHRKLSNGSPYRDTGRTLLALLSQLKKYFEDHELYPKSPQGNVTHQSIEHQLHSALRVANQSRLLNKAA
jgi:DNA invertase Pin-like site-specific DNA recombinase